MISLTRNGGTWVLADDAGSIRIPDDQARSLALRILAQAPAAGEELPSAETRGQKIARLLAGDIADGVFRPGRKLNEVALARRYGVSRTPIREALALLSATGVLTRESNRGCWVSTKTEDNNVSQP